MLHWFTQAKPMPVVSIISPAYNHALYLNDCVRSVLAQTSPDWEMIIIDDGSSDQTFAQAQSWAEQDPRIKAYTQENVGIHRLAETYNRAFGMCQGEFIAILECDDVWEEEKLELQVKCLQEHPEVIMTYGRAYQANMDLSRRLGIMPSGDRKDFFENRPLFSFAVAAISGGIFPPPVSVLIRKSALNACGGFQQSHGLPLVDTPTFVALSALGPFLFMDKILGTWRSTPNQITKTYTAQMTESFFGFALDTCQKYAFSQEVVKGVRKHYRSALVVAYARSGRYRLIRKEFAAARKDYLHAIFLSPVWVEPIWKLRALAGLVCSIFNKDVEGLARFLGKRYY